jgi:predicted dehydrogenase
MSACTLALIGAGSRGDEAYGGLALSGAVDAAFTALAEPDAARRSSFAARHGIPPSRCFADWRELLSAGRLADGLLVCSPDGAHFEQARAALGVGYGVLLEKPMSNDPGECLDLGDLAREKGSVFMICHVLRYSPFFATLKGLLDSGEIGQLAAISHSENIGYWHFAHSFVRGNWRSAVGGSPLVLAKSCHDMDILLWLAGRDCERVASFGSLSYFNEAHAPAGSGTRCAIDCSIEPSCPYSARSIYRRFRGSWPSNIISPGQEVVDIENAIAEGPYGRCVFRSDNDVVDHQSTILEFEGGVTAAFSLSAFTGQISRTIKLMGSEGEIRGDMEKNEIELVRHGSSERKTFFPSEAEGNHGGGDLGLFRDFVRAVATGDSTGARTRAEDSVQGHLMAFAAEESRRAKTVVDMRAYEAGLRGRAGRR